jgi:hypothetical protein
LFDKIINSSVNVTIWGLSNHLLKLLNLFLVKLDSLHADDSSVDVGFEFLFRKLGISALVKESIDQL